MVVINSVRTLFSQPGSVIESLTRKFPRVYLVLITLVALLGYAYILAFPILLLSGILNVYAAIVMQETVDWQSAIIWTAVILLSGLVIFRSMQYKPRQPVGLSLTEDKTPELFSLVQQLCEHYERTSIQRLVITGNYELDIVKIPRWALPGWSSNTLLIGLPVLQCLSPRQFECMLARRIGQFSRQHNFLANWLYQLRATWQQYRACYSQQKGFGIEPLKYFFAVYSPLYSAASTWAARQDELNADSYAMELYNDEEVREMITADALCRWYLNNQFWPAVDKVASTESKSPPLPHVRMAAAAYSGMAGEKLNALMARIIKHKPASNDALPSLQDRIENIGHDKVRLLKPAKEIAAVHYLGKSLKPVIDLIDKLWLKQRLENRKRHDQPGQNPPSPEQISSA
ncbi:MAG: hypothetical protein JSW45_03740 [Thiotrichales bacterium]|nr:MAG: hypothetical protein JSW45_03740 [Thiotrichales bacterium]